MSSPPAARALLVAAVVVLAAGVLAAATRGADSVAAGTGAPSSSTTSSGIGTSSPVASTTTTPTSVAATSASSTSLVAVPASTVTTAAGFGPSSTTAATSGIDPTTTTLAPAPPGTARVSVTNYYARAVDVTLTDAQTVSIPGLAPDAGTGYFELPVAADHGDSAVVAPVEEATCGTSDSGDNFVEGHTYSLTVVQYTGGPMGGGDCGDGSRPGLLAYDETCGNTFWVGNHDGGAATVCG